MPTSTFETAENSKNLVVLYDFDYVISNEYFPNAGNPNYNLFPSSGTVANITDAKLNDKSLILTGSKYYYTKVNLNLTPVTIMFWFKVKKIYNDTRILKIGNIELSYSDGVFNLNNTLINKTTENMSDWNLITLSISSSSVSFYINKTLYRTISGTYSPTDFILGPSTSTTSEFYINEFKIFNSILTEGEIQFMFDTPIAIDELGNLWCKSIQYSENVEYYETGNVLCPEIEDSSDTLEIYENKIVVDEIKQIF